MKYFLLAVLLSFTFSLASENVIGYQGIFRCKNKKPVKICVIENDSNISVKGFKIYKKAGSYYTNHGIRDISRPPEKINKCTIEIDHSLKCVKEWTQ